MEKKTPINIMLYTRYFTFSYIYYRQPQAVFTTNSVSKLWSNINILNKISFL